MGPTSDAAAIVRTTSDTVTRGRRWGRLSALLLSTALLLSVLPAELASAQDGRTPPRVFTGNAGERIDGISGAAPSNCRNIRNVVIHFGDGTSGPADAVGATTFSGHHTYDFGGDYLGSVDLDITCTSNPTADPDDQSPPVTRDYHVVGVPGGWPLGFIVRVGGGCAAAQSAGARSAQAACSFPPKVTAPKKAVPLEVKKYFEAKRDKLVADSTFLCGSQEVTAPNLIGQVVTNFLFAPYCLSTVARHAYYYSIVKDPPDAANATKIARPRRVALPKVSKTDCRGSRRCAAVRAASKRFVARSARVVSLTRAMSASVDRFAGAAELGAIVVNDVQVLQFAMTKVYAGKLAAAVVSQRSAGKRLRRALRRARVKSSITRAEARAEAEKLSRLEGFSEAELSALEKNGVTRAQLREVFTDAVPLARAVSLNGALTRGEPTRRLRRFYRSLKVAQIAHIENSLFKSRAISRRRHAKLTRDLKRALAARSKRSRRRSMRRFVRDAKRVRGVYGSLLRTAGRAAAK